MQSARASSVSEFASASWILPTLLQMMALKAYCWESNWRHCSQICFVSFCNFPGALANIILGMVVFREDHKQLGSGSQSVELQSKVDYCSWEREHSGRLMWVCTGVWTTAPDELFWEVIPVKLTSHPQMCAHTQRYQQSWHQEGLP